MISLITNVPKFKNDIADMIRPFFGFNEVVYEEKKDAYLVVNHEHIENNNNTWNENFYITKNNIETSYVYVYVYLYGDITDDIKYKREVKRSVKLGMYYALKQIENKYMPWGALTGIRPTRLYRSMDVESDGHAEDIMRNDYDVAESKLKLVKQIISSQESIYNVDCDSSVNLYIGIPFCLTRCLYCSFISFDMSIDTAPIDEYTEALIKEINWFNKWRKKNNKKLRSIYVGGGTPTAIGVKYLEQILSAIRLDESTEFTVEAGRPDTIDKPMLDMLSNYKVNRISINPQTMNEVTLQFMKRQHTTKDILEALEISNEYNFIVNMDLIMGLTGETIEMVQNTLAIVKDFKIDNLTIHTLAIKRSSQLKEQLKDFEPTDESIVTKMVQMAHETAYQMNMQPYYMYRQKYISGNLENVGFSTENNQCLYNIDIMDETHNLIALGAGAVSKRMYCGIKKHVRLANNKSITHYISNIDQLLLKKDDLFAYN